MSNFGAIKVTKKLDISVLDSGVSHENSINVIKKDLKKLNYKVHIDNSNIIFFQRKYALQSHGWELIIKYLHLFNKGSIKVTRDFYEVRIFAQAHLFALVCAGIFAFVFIYFVYSIHLLISIAIIVLGLLFWIAIINSEIKNFVNQILANTHKV